MDPDDSELDAIFSAISDTKGQDQNGEYHFTNAPNGMQLRMYDDGSRRWFNAAGQKHDPGNDRPAVVNRFGTKYWYRNGKCHREGGPAVERATGTLEWFRGGQLHREDGPALTTADGMKEYWLNDVQMTQEEHARRTQNR